MDEKKNRSIYESLNEEQKKTIGDFMKDFIISQIKDQVDIFKMSNCSSESAEKFIFETENMFKKNIIHIGFPEDWEHAGEIIYCQQAAVNDIENYFDGTLSGELKKLNSRSLVYQIHQLRKWFEEELKEIYPSGDFVTLITDNGLEYKDHDIQNMWDGVLFFTKKHKQLIDPTTGGLF